MGPSPASGRRPGAIGSAGSEWAAAVRQPIGDALVDQAVEIVDAPPPTHI